MVAQRRLAGRLGSVHLNHTAAGNPTDPQRQIEAQGSGGNHLDGQLGAGLSQLHDGTLAKLLLDLRQGEIEGSLSLIHDVTSSAGPPQPSIVGRSLPNICSLVNSSTWLVATTTSRGRRGGPPLPVCGWLPAASAGSP